jgi:hypothetical protein
MCLVHSRFESKLFGVLTGGQRTRYYEAMHSVCRAERSLLLTYGTHNARIGLSLIFLLRDCHVPSSAASAVLAQLEESYEA